jgi:hypothetical protein
MLLIWVVFGHKKNFAIFVFNVFFIFHTLYFIIYGKRCLFTIFLFVYIVVF